MPSADELKYILRRLRRAPMFTAIALITLAVGIGANTAMFSVIHGVLLKPLPYTKPDQLVAVWATAPGLGIKDLNPSPSMYFFFRRQSQTLQDLGLWEHGEVTITGIGQPERVESLLVTDGLLPLLGVRPVIGRTFTRKDDSPGTPETIILTYGYWQRRFGADPSVLGRRILIGGRANEIIGVLPRGFNFMNTHAALVEPFQFDPAEMQLGNFSYHGVGRLKPGVTIAQANADAGQMLTTMVRTLPVPPGLSRSAVESTHVGPNIRPLMQDVVGDVRTVLWTLMGVVAMVLLIACANVGNLLLVRAEGRQQELAVRASLGANWMRIARELIGESLALSVAGGLIGLALAYGLLRLLAAQGPANLPRLDELSIDTSVLLFTLAVALATGVLFGLTPVFKYARPRLAAVLREGGRTLSEGRERHRARSVLVALQVALAVVLLICSGLMIRTFQALRHVQPGFTEPDRILTFRVSIPEALVPDAGRVARMHFGIQQKLASIPGVTVVGLANAVTMDGQTDNDPIFAEDRPPAQGKFPPLRRFKFIAPGYLRAMGNPLLAGRDFTWTDIFEGRPMVLVSANFAREYWKTPDAAIGKRVRQDEKDPWREIIGVAGDEHDDGVDQKAPKIVYWPFLRRNYWSEPVDVVRNMAFAVRSTRTISPGFLNEIRQAVWSVNPDLPVANPQTEKQIYDKSLARTSFTLLMLAIAAAMALLLALVGIYGVISYAVSQRTREIGIRMALGAEQTAVRRMFVRHGVVLAASGAICGLAAALALTRLIASLLFGVQLLDPVTYGGVAATLVAAALFASYIPARRATTIDPVEALRVE